MKKLLALTFVAFMFTTIATAQVDRKTSDTTAKTDKRARRDGHGKKEKMQQIKELGLNKEQMGQMKSLNKETKAKMQALKAQENITVKEMREKKKAIADERIAKLKTILTPEQMAKMEAGKKDKSKNHKRKKGMENADDDMTK